MSIPFEMKGLDHVVLRVTDLAAARQFYQDVLGCVPERELPDMGLYQLRAGQHLIDLVTVGSKIGGLLAPDPERKNQDHFCLSVTMHGETADAPSEIMAYLESAGIQTLETGQRYGAEGVGWSVYVSDPDGNIVEIKPAGTS